ncbi:MAG TPA: DUF167 domain-containing protein [Rhodocyclaceae bacterium]|nr:DUF167 domain-containing protein [Rhodocyclaceae bacterium]
MKLKASRKGAEIGSFCAWDGDTLVLNVLGKPSAGKDAIGKVIGKQLNVSVTEAPVAGRATDHMVRFLASQFGVKVTDIEVVFGRFNVNKQLRIRAPRSFPSVVGKHLSLAAPAPEVEPEVAVTGKKRRGSK